jgi:3-oxoacyl-[acyl-carrier-protein] synthase-3
MPERIDKPAPPAKTAANDRVANNPFFADGGERRLASPDYTSADMGVLVIERLLEKNDFSADQVDLIICSCLMDDMISPGVAATIQHRIGAKRATVINIDTACVGWLSGINMATAFIESGRYKNIVVVTITNFISRLPELQKDIRYRPLGDGATASLVQVGERASVLASYERSHGEHYGLLSCTPSTVDGETKRYWEAGSGYLTVNFTEPMLDLLFANALELVPDAAQKCLAQAGMSTSDVNLLITHQPNPLLMDEWRKRIGILPPRAHDTFKIYGNSFQGTLPITFADALEKGIVKRGDIILFATFANGGELVSSMLVRW